MKNVYGVRCVFGWCFFPDGRDVGTREEAEVLAVELRKRWASIEYRVEVHPGPRAASQGGTAA